MGLKSFFFVFHFPFPYLNHFTGKLRLPALLSHADEYFPMLYSPRIMHSDVPVTVSASIFRSVISETSRIIVVSGNIPEWSRLYSLFKGS